VYVYVCACVCLCVCVCVCACACALVLQKPKSYKNCIAGEVVVSILAPHLSTTEH
jgi:hypothetical protein